MQVNKLHILPTNNTPEILLNPEGIIIIKGRGMVLDNTEITNKIMNWLDEYIGAPAEITNVNVAFEYLNTYCTTKLVSLLRKISQVSLQNKKYLIHWYYEDDDEDILERGEYISATLNIPVDFVRTNDIKSCC
jgi:hypothetical protein